LVGVLFRSSFLPFLFPSLLPLEPDEALQFINEIYLEPYEGTFHDYAEAVVQFGYVNLFSVVSHLSSSPALLPHSLPALNLSGFYSVISCHITSYPITSRFSSVSAYLKQYNERLYTTVCLSVCLKLLCSCTFPKSNMSSPNLYLFALTISSSLPLLSPSPSPVSFSCLPLLSPSPVSLSCLLSPSPLSFSCLPLLSPSPVSLSCLLSPSPLSFSSLPLLSPSPVSLSSLLLLSPVSSLPLLSPLSLSFSSLPLLSPLSLSCLLSFCSQVLPFLGIIALLENLLKVRTSPFTPCPALYPLQLQKESTIIDDILSTIMSCYNFTWQDEIEPDSVS
jgi:hypothetical protein